MTRTSKPPSKRARKAKAPAPSAPPSNARLWIAAIFALLVGLAVAVGLVLFRKKVGVGRPVDVEISANASEDEILAKLEAAGVIDSRRAFWIYVHVTGGLHAKPGLHMLADDLSLAEVARRLSRSPSAARIRVTIPEGFHRFDIAKRLREKRICDEASFGAAVTERALLDELGLRNVPSAEGWLFPATYELAADSDARDVVRRLVTEGRERYEKLARAHADGVQKLAQELHFGPQEIITLASIIEKEAAVDEERPLIASVFENRLREPASGTSGKLQADPTAGYGCLVGAPPAPTCVEWLRTGTTRVNADIQHDGANAWSTYTHAGLPPTPIANPGERSIEAVLAPATTRYFYFVAKGQGRHTFSETLDKHEKATTKP